MAQTVTNHPPFAPQLGTPRKAPVTFDTKGDARAWLALRQSEILRGEWAPPPSTRCRSTGS